MRSPAKYILLALTLTAWPAGTVLALTRVYAKIDSSTDIYPGSSFVYSVVVEGGDKPTNIDLAPIAKYEPRPIGNQSAVQIINGRTTSTYSVNYSITAEKSGRIRLDPVTVTIQGKKFTTNPVEVTVSKPGTTDKLKLEFLLSERKCYVGQPIIMTVKWYIMAQVRNAAFNVPVFRSTDFYIEDMPESQTAWAQQTYSIHNVPVILAESRQLMKGVETAIISFSKVLIAKRAGRLLLGPISVSADMAVGRVRTGRLLDPYGTKYERFSVSSEPVQLEVLPLPDADRPAEFYGLVGRYTISASATPTKVSVGDPITLTIKIGGSQYLKPVQWPELEQISELAANFKIPSQKASPTIENGYKIFTQTIRCTNDRVTQIPSIPLAFFDADKGQYVVAKTEPIELEVAPTKILTDADLEGRDFAPINKEVEAIKKGLSANYYVHDALVNQTFSPLAAMVSPGYAVLWSVPLAGLIISSCVKLFTRTSPERTAQRRRRQAKNKALKQLKKVMTGEPQQRQELLVSTMKQYIGERFDKIVGSLTADDCHYTIESATHDSQAAEKYRDIITTCEASRYAAAQVDVDASQIKEVAELVRGIDRKAKA